MSSKASFLERHFPSFLAWAGNLGWPILLRQLRADFRKHRFFVTQLVCLAALGMALTAVVVGKVEDRTSTATQIGQYLFSLFFCLQYLIILVIFPAFSSTAFTEERVANTMDLLVTSTLRPAEIVWGKFLASSVYCIMYVIASIPLLSIAFLFGGVKLSEVLVAYTILVGLTLLVSMYGVCVSGFFSANLRSTLSVYASITVVLSASLWLYDKLLADMGKSQSIVAALLEYLQLDGERGALRALPYLFLACVAFAYMFLISANRVRPTSHDRSSGLRVLTFLTIPGILASQAAGTVSEASEAAGLAARRGTSAFLVAAESLGGVIILAGVLLFLTAVVFPAEETRVSRRNRRRFGRFRGLLLPVRIFAPGAFWGVIYCAVLSLLVSGGLYLVWKVWLAIDGVAGSPLERQVTQTLLALPPYVLTFASLGFLLSACDFAPLYSRLTVFFVFLITLLLPVIFMVSETPDSLWTMYYLSPVTIWSSLQEFPPDRQPQFVLWGVPVVAIAQYLFSALALGLFAAAQTVSRRKGYPTWRL